MRPITYRIWRRFVLAGHALYSLTGHDWNPAVPSGLRAQMKRDRELEKLATMPAITRADCEAILGHALKHWAYGSGECQRLSSDVYTLSIRGAANNYLLDSLRHNAMFWSTCWEMSVPERDHAYVTPIRETHTFRLPGKE